MAMIDILKLNEELDKMIANQEAEIKEIDEKICERHAYRYQQFVSSLATMGEVTKKIGRELKIFLGSFDLGNGARRSCWIDFSPKHTDRYHVQFSGSVNPVVTATTIIPEYGYDRLSNKFLINQVVDWWAENAAEFEHGFESACVKAIKEKAEEANAKYQEALERKERNHEI